MAFGAKSDKTLLLKALKILKSGLKSGVLAGIRSLFWGSGKGWYQDVEKEIKLVRVYATDLEPLKNYIAALYRHDEDFDALVNIEEGVRSLFKHENLATPYFIKRGEERLGYCILTRYHSVEKGGLTIYIDELYVEEQFRRAGAGRAIMENIIEIARTQGAKTLWANTEPFNEAAQAFFSSQGFRVNPYKNFERPI